MGYKRAVVVLAVLYAVGRVLQFFNKKKPPSGREPGDFFHPYHVGRHSGTLSVTGTCVQEQGHNYQLAAVVVFVSLKVLFGLILKTEKLLIVS